MKLIILSLLLSINLAYAKELTKIGSALLEYDVLFFSVDVYEITYFRNDMGNEELVLDYKVDVEKKHSIEGWNVGLDHLFKEKPVYKEKAKWILNNTIDLKDGDKFVIRKNIHEVILIKNNQEMAKVIDPIIAEMIFEPWLGKKPIDKKIKSKLLNREDS
ncbi:chalcone isomerase family protein [Bacteriovoracaceae bacterium]|nr:chalcone isomerase family protein [Bacteriovoracaceae bacterium]